MRKHGKTWWGQQFIAALEQRMDSGRLQRGRSYASPSRILSFKIDATGFVTATVRGNINPYFGVTKEPRYKIEFQLKQISDTKRKMLIAELGSRADLISPLLMNEMPDGINDAFAASGFSLLPDDNEDDFDISECSCPDWANPCKHIAGVYYRLAHLLDRDPLLLLELRGIARNNLRAELAKTPLGQALAPLMSDDSLLPAESVDSLYPPLVVQTPPPKVDARSFWHGRVPLPTDDTQPVNAVSVPAVLIKKGGDFPPFWERSQSFIAVMEDFYKRIKIKNKQRL